MNSPISHNQEKKLFPSNKTPASLRLRLLGVRLRSGVTQILSSFSRTERIIFRLLTALLLVSSLGILWNINKMFLVEIPSSGGELREGVIGAPRFINPLLAISDADRDLTLLVYSGLMRATPEGKLVPDIAKEYTISEDGLVYTFTLKEGLEWHDGKQITSDDILFTIAKVQDSILRSPKRASWEGVSTQKINERTIQFTLKQPYSPFLENTTLGILPQHIWGEISSEQFGFSKFNVQPIGSGPYKVVGIKKDSSGIPKHYKLSSFKKFSLGSPYIDALTVNFYANEDELLRALDKGEIEIVNAIRAEKALGLEKKGMRVERYVLPRVFGVFFNQNQNTIFTNKTIRKALNQSIGRKRIIQDVLFGYATAINGPLPPGSLGYTANRQINSANDNLDDGSENVARATTTTSVEKAIQLLEQGGWKINDKTGIRERKTKKETRIFQFSIATSNAEELKNTVQLIKDAWEKLGARVDLKIFNTGDLNQNVIRPRKYDALFFGEIIGRESDPFAFWHSSQRNDPGLNIALYTNITADKLLEDGRVSFDREKRFELYKQFEAEVIQDIPAVFVYSPDFIYVLPEKVKGIQTGGTITIPSERFIDIYKWYIETDRVWKIFIK